MVLGKLALIVCGGVLCASLATAQATGLIWPENCSNEVRLTNTSGLKLGSLWVAIGDDNLNNSPEIAKIVVNDGGGFFWKVDDNEDGDIGDGLGELEETDSTPSGNPQGWHRVQAPTSGDVINPGQIYRLTLCARGGQSLKNRSIQLFGIQPGPSGNGDAGTATGSGPQTIDSSGDEIQVTLVQGQVPPISPLTFTFQLTNGYSFALDKIKVFARQSDVTVLNVTSSSGGTYMSGSELYFFTIPLGAGATENMTFTLNHLSTLPPRGTSLPVTDIVFQRVIVSVPSLSTWGKLAVGLGLALAGCVVLRRRRTLAPVQG